MTKYARIDAAGVIHEVVGAEALATFNPETAALFRPVEDDAVPAPAARPAPRAPTVTPPQFFMLWTVAEEVQLEALAETDAVVRTFLKRLNDPRLTEVDLSLQSVREGVKYCLGKIGADVAARAAEILAGVLK